MQAPLTLISALGRLASSIALRDVCSETPWSPYKCARHLVEMAVARHPDLLECCFGNAKSVHIDELVDL